MDSTMQIAGYLVKLTDAELQILLDIVNEKICDRASKLGSWLCKEIYQECLRRRLALSGARFIEPDPLSIEPLEWSSAALADASQVLLLLSYAVANDPVGELIDQLHRGFTTIANARLARLPK